MRKRPPLYVIDEPAPLVVRNVLPLKGNVRRRAPVLAAVDAPLPPERAWRDLIRRLTRNPVPPKRGG